MQQETNVPVGRRPYRKPELLAIRQDGVNGKSVSSTPEGVIFNGISYGPNTMGLS